MGIAALTHRDNGSAVAVPESHDDWQQWVSAGRTRNWMLDDPLIDWLQLHGKSKGYVPESELPGYAADLDFLPFIFEKGQEFEAGILRLLQARYEVVTVANDHHDIRRLDKAEGTFAAMLRGVPVIYQAVLWDAENMTYGSPDFLVRSDVLRELFPSDIGATEAAQPAPDLGGGSWHYCVVDTKFTTLRLNAAGTELGNDSSAPAYKAQLYIYNRMLGRLQGYLPPESYLLGRGWQRTQSRVPYRGSSALERLGRIPQNGTVANGLLIADKVADALAWVSRLRTEGQIWELVPPSVPELYPNMSNSDDGDMFRAGGLTEPGPDADSDDEHVRSWENVKKRQADELKELTQLWQVGVSGRKEAHAEGIYRWDDPRVTPEALKVRGASGDTGARFRRVVEVNTTDGPAVLPARVEAGRNEWHGPSAAEFYVDFEFCSDLNDDFSLLPEKGGQPLIFMIGCGHLQGGVWQFQQFTTDELSEAEEIRIIREWVDYMSSVCDQQSQDNANPRVFHWSHAEVTQLENAYNSARARHGATADWPQFDWYDFLAKAMREEPIAVRGALGFGLKAVAKAMLSHGYIETDWPDSQIDGLGAMVGAWRCDEEARQKGVSMTDLPLMGEIAGYNELDCKAMMEIIRYLREHH